VGLRRDIVAISTGDHPNRLIAAGSYARLTEQTIIRALEDFCSE